MGKPKPKVKKKCKHCGKEFCCASPSEAKRRQYCSEVCGAKAQWARYYKKHGKNKGDIEPNFTAKCAYCGKTFSRILSLKEQAKDVPRCCSASCKSKYQWKDKKQTISDKLRRCAYCGKEFVHVRGHKTQRFCSLKCANLRATDKAVVNDRMLVCKNCGEEFFRHLTDKQMDRGMGIYCSRKCHDEYKAKKPIICAYCGKSFLADKGCGTYCSRRCSGLAHRKKGSDSSGYLLITVGEPGNSRRTQEHRHIMEQVLGRPLATEEHIHHINGKRGDNRPENLEIWIKGHPQGVRARDANKSRKNEERLAHENYNLKKLLQETREELDNIQKTGTMPDKTSTVSMALH